MMKDIEIEYKDLIITADVHAISVDASFSHAFGIEKVTEIEITDVEITSCQDEEGIEVSVPDREVVEEMIGDQFYSRL